MTGNTLVRWLLGLQSVPSGAPDVRFAWEHPVSPASWVVIVGAAVLVGWMSYRRMEIGRARRRSLVALRAAVIVLLAMLLAGPLLEVPRESIEPDAVIVLADRSRSMEVEDLVGPGGSTQSRDAALRSLAMAPTPFDAIGAEHRVQWYGFLARRQEAPADQAHAVVVREDHRIAQRVVHGAGGQVMRGCQALDGSARKAHPGAIAFGYPHQFERLPPQLDIAGLRLRLEFLAQLARKLAGARDTAAEARNRLRVARIRGRQSLLSLDMPDDAAPALDRLLVAGRQQIAEAGAQVAAMVEQQARGRHADDQLVLALWLDHRLHLACDTSASTDALEETRPAVRMPKVTPRMRPLGSTDPMSSCSDSMSMPRGTT